MPPPRQATESSRPGETGRAILSLLLFIHLFIVVICLSSSFAPSSLQRRLGDVFRPYTELLHLNLEGTRLYLTHATQLDVDHRIEVRTSAFDAPASAEWEMIRRGRRGTARYGRYQQLADTMAYFQEDEEVTGLIAAAVARNYAADGQQVALVRCRQHTLLPWDVVDSNVSTVRDPDNPMYFSNVYEADVLTAADGEIRMLKRSDAALESAPTRGVDQSKTSLSIE